MYNSIICLLKIYIIKDVRLMIQNNVYKIQNNYQYEYHVNRTDFLKYTIFSITDIC